MEEAGFLGCAEICNVGRILMWTNPERVWLELRGCQRHRFSIVSRKGQGDQDSHHQHPEPCLRHLGCAAPLPARCLDRLLFFSSRGKIIPPQSCAPSVSSIPANFLLISILNFYFQHKLMAPLSFRSQSSSAISPSPSTLHPPLSCILQEVLKFRLQSFCLTW